MKQFRKQVQILIPLLLMGCSAIAGDLEIPHGEPQPSMVTLKQIYEKLEIKAQPREGLPLKTGQVNCYGTTTDPTPIPCEGTGQDGDYLKGVETEGPRFTDNNDGTVLDNITGLTWLKNTNVTISLRSFQQAVADITQLNTNGAMNGNNSGDTSNNRSHQSDWRLPTVFELRSLIDYGSYHPALPAGHPFINTGEGLYYWTNDNSLTVFFRTGIVHRNTTEDEIYVWPVRGGE